MNRAILKMKAVPGLYYVSTVSQRKQGFEEVVEVDAEGVVYQLTPDMERDSVLSDDGWNDEAVVAPYNVELK